MKSKNRKEREAAAWDIFVLSLANKSKSEIQEAMGIFSEKEKQIVVYRLMVADSLKQGMTYREIGDDLWLSPQTISAIKKSLLSKSGDYESYRSGYRKARSYSSIPTPRKPVRKRRPTFSIFDASDLEAYRDRLKEGK